MSGILSVYSQLLSEIDHAINTMLTHPLWMLRFTIPILIIFLSSFVAGIYHRWQSLDAMPSFERKRELFRLPHDFFNAEVSKIMEEDYSDVVYRIGLDFQDAKLRVQAYKRLIRRYRRYEARLNSSFKTFRTSAKAKRRDTLDELLSLHDGFKYRSERRG